MRYYNEFVDGAGCTYSCDMVRYKIDIRKDCADKFGQMFARENRMDVNLYPVSFVSYRYRQLLTIAVGESVVTMGIGFNGHGGSDERLQGFVEFNPNKVFPEWKEEFLMVCSMCSVVEPVRCDIAIDIPIERVGCSLLKDNRQYAYEQYAADDYTEYLGQRNHTGRVKLYNKAKEQRLDYALTRLEITTEPDMKSFKQHMPQVALSECKQIDFSQADTSDLSHNDSVVISLLNTLPLDERMVWYQKFTYRHRQKISKYILTDNRLNISLKCVSGVLMEVNKYSGFCA